MIDRYNSCYSYHLLIVSFSGKESIEEISKLVIFKLNLISLYRIII